MLEQQLSDLESAALARIEAARSPNDLEQVRIEVLGRKGALTQVSKDMGKLAPEDRARVGKLLNAVKQKLESADEYPPPPVRRGSPGHPPQGRVAGSDPARARPARAICIPSRRSNPKSRTSSSRSVSPCWMAPKWKTNITISTR